MQACFRAKGELENWLWARNIEKAFHDTGGEIKWSKPNVGWVKCNSDVAFFREQDKMGFGFCLRDDMGCVVATKSSWSSPVLRVVDGEAIGLLMAMRWAVEYVVDPAIKPQNRIF